MARSRTKPDTGSTLAERAYRSIKHGILRGEFPEGSFLVEAEILSRFAIGRTPFREACNRLHNEHLLEVVPRRGYFVPEMSFRAVRDLLETRIVLEGIAAELAALRAEPSEVDVLDAAYKETLKCAKSGTGLDAFLGANQKFHLQIARMSHNIEFEALLRGVLERSTRLVYLAAQSAQEMPKDVEALLKPIVEAIRRHDAVAAHDAVVRDITQGQLNALGRDVWGAGAGIRRNGALLERAVLPKSKP